MKENLRQSAVEKLSRAAGRLYQEGAKDVYVFGSVLKQAEFNERSDVDIAVNGLVESKQRAVFSTLEEIFGDTPFDLIFLDEEIRPEVRARIQKEGVRWKP